MKPKLSDYFTKEFIKFFLCNGFAAVINFGSRILFSRFLEYMPSVFLAYACGMITAFTLNKFLVFDAKKGSTSRQFMGFFIVNMLGLAQTLFFSMALREWLFPAIGWTFYPDGIAHLVGISIPVFTSFIGHKYFSFRRTGKSETQK